MDSRRELTRQILDKVGGGNAGANARAPSAGPRGESEETLARKGDAGHADVLVAAASGLPRAVGLVREVVSISRWGLRADVLVDDALAKQICRYVPQRNMHRSAGLPEGGALGFERAECFASLRAVVVASSADMLAKLAFGTADGPVGEAALWALWHGLPLYMDLSVADTAPDGTPCQNPALAALYAGCREKLVALGVRHAGPGEVCPEVVRVAVRDGVAAVGRSGAGDGVAPLMQSPGANNGRLFVTKKDVQLYTGPPEWALPANATVTDAAREEAKHRNILLRRMGR